MTELNTKSGTEAERPSQLVDGGVGWQCPCCQNFTLNTRAQYDICEVCFWEDDGTVSPEEESGPNYMTLAKGRANYALCGAHDGAFVRHVRKPLPSELPASDPTPKGETA